MNRRDALKAQAAMVASVPFGLWAHQVVNEDDDWQAFFPIGTKEDALRIAASPEGTWHDYNIEWVNKK